MDAIAYGTASLPNNTGHFEIEIPTWRPMRGYSEEAQNFFLGGPPTLNGDNPIVKNVEQRKYLTTMSSGTVHVSCDVVTKAFKSKDIN